MLKRPAPRPADTEALSSAHTELEKVAFPFAAQMVYLRYPPSACTVQGLRAQAKALRRQVLDRRDSITHRAGAIQWHVNWLFAEYEARAAIDNETWFDDARAMSNLMAAERTLVFIFDDIVLNSVSLLDYVGQFLAIAITGGRGVARWEKLVLQVSGKDGEAKYGTELVQLILEMDRKWVHKLVKYRNDLAHQLAKWASGRRTIHPMEMMTSITVDLPPDAKPLVIAMNDGPADADLLAGAQHIGLTCLRASHELVAAAFRSHNLTPGWVPSTV